MTLVSIRCQVCGKVFNGADMEVFREWARHYATCREKKRVWLTIRRNIIKRDEECCARCGSKSSLHVHHKVPRSKGGKDVPANLITLCRRCHGLVHRRKIPPRAWSDQVVEMWKEELRMEGELIV